MSTNVTIHGKRTETIYPFTIEYKGETITGRYITVDGEDEDELLGLPEEDEIWEIDEPLFCSKKENNDYEKWFIKEAGDKIKRAIQDYEKIHSKRTS